MTDQDHAESVKDSEAIAWVKRAYGETTQFTIWNMEVAYEAGRAARLADSQQVKAEVEEIEPPYMKRNEFTTAKGWKLHDCIDGKPCRAEIGGGCATGYCAHYGVNPISSIKV